MDAFVHPELFLINSSYINNMHRYESIWKPCLHTSGDTLKYVVTNYKPDTCICYSSPQGVW